MSDTCEGLSPRSIETLEKPALLWCEPEISLMRDINSPTVTTERQVRR